MYLKDLFPKLLPKFEKKRKSNDIKYSLILYADEISHEVINEDMGPEQSLFQF